MPPKANLSRLRADGCRTWILDCFTKVQMTAHVLREEHGQDLVEYALVVALISLAAVAGMQSVAVALSAAYTNLGTKLSSYIT